MATRLERAHVNRLFLVKKPTPDDPTFHVLGTTNNSYEVDFLKTSSPTCTCMDYKLRKRCCKHILFVMVRVLSVSVASETLSAENVLAATQKAQIILDTGVCPVGVAYNSRYDVGNNSRSDTVAIPDVQGVPQRAYTEDDECPVCFEPFATELLVYCTKVCGNSVHKVCFDMWKRNKGKTCVLCRADMK